MLVAILVIVLLGLLIVAAKTYYASPKPALAPSPNTSAPTSSVNQNEQSSWLQYADASAGFRFSYPSTYSAIDKPEEERGKDVVAEFENASSTFGFSVAVIRGVKNFKWSGAVESYYFDAENNLRNRFSPEEIKEPIKSENGERIYLLTTGDVGGRGQSYVFVNFQKDVVVKLGTGWDINDVEQRQLEQELIEFQKNFEDIAATFEFSS